tara:strand:- start:88 stop:675 length:588 start_codon:yes stop_codon:yes gene_type:complete
MPECPVCRRQTQESNKWYTITKNCSPITPRNNIVVVIERPRNARQINNRYAQRGNRTQCKLICIRYSCLGLATIHILVIIFAVGWLANLIVFGEDFVFRRGLTSSQVMFMVAQCFFIGVIVTCSFSACITTCIYTEDELTSRPTMTTPLQLNDSNHDDDDDELLQAIEPSRLALHTHHLSEEMTNINDTQQEVQS